MQLGLETAELTALLLLVFTTMKTGITVSGAAHIAHDGLRWLAQHTSYPDGQPDPTVYKRSFRRLYDAVFHPIGMAATSRSRTDSENEILYTLAVGAASIVMTIGGYLLLSSGVLSIGVASYYTAGVVPDLTAVINQIAATCTLFGLVVMLHSAERVPAPPDSVLV